MKLPNADRAFINIDKLRNYCLSLKHPRGKNKARVFVAVLELTADKASTLYDAILKAVLTEEAILGDKDKYGQRYIVDIQMSSQRGIVKIRTAWIIKKEEDFPRLTSCYIL